MILLNQMVHRYTLWRKEMSKETYAEVAWTVEDIQTLRPEMTDEQAAEWLQSNQKYIRDRLVELGWDVIESLLSYDNK